ncbi:MAG: hypothetical protein WCS96_14140, partial [Victivallales bacterium]
KIWKIRVIKEYKEAHSHLLVGEVLEETQNYVRLKCRTFHFGKCVQLAKDINCGVVAERIIPWNRIEIINVNDPKFDYERAKTVKTADNAFILSDGKHSCGVYNVKEESF